MSKRTADTSAAAIEFKSSSAGAMSSPSPSSSPTSPNSKKDASYAGLAWQYMYNAKAAVSNALRKDLKSLLDSSSAIHCLGNKGNGEDFLQWNCRKIQYFSYRNRLPQMIGNTTLDHDAGWGCMVRTGQMMLCVALYRSVKMLHGGGGRPNLSVGSNKSGGGSNSQNISTAAFHDGDNSRMPDEDLLGLHDYDPDIPDGETLTLEKMRDMFRDIPTAEFSIYNIVSAGAKYHIAPGEWFNATSLALSLKHLILSKPNVPITAVHGRESTVEYHEVQQALAHGKPVLVMVSCMLGMNNISQNYFPALHEVMGYSKSVGIVGGKPKKSMYFFGSHKQTLFHLDPHYVQPAFVSPQTIGQFNGNMEWVGMADADSSMLLCFLIEPKEEALAEWCSWVEHKLPAFSEYPIFSIHRRRGCAAAKKPAATTTGTTCHSSSGGGSSSKPATTSASPSSSSSAAASHHSKAAQQQQQQKKSSQQQPADDDDDDFECIDTDDWGDCDELNGAAGCSPSTSPQKPLPSDVQIAETRLKRGSDLSSGGGDAFSQQTSLATATAAPSSANGNKPSTNSTTNTTTTTTTTGAATGEAGITFSDDDSDLLNVSGDSDKVAFDDL